MSVLTVVQEHCRIHGLNVPGGVISSTDTTVRQLLALLKQLLGEMVAESKYNVITLETTFTAIAAEDQGAITDYATEGYQWVYPETFFDRTLRRPLYGPLDETEWQRIKALPNPGPFYKFRIRGDHILINPAPAAPLSTIAFEYASSWAVRNSSGTLQATITADSDTFLFPEPIILRGLAFRWKQIKGLPYQADETAYFNLLNNYIARDKVRPRINVAEPKPAGIQPGVFVPSGNWNV
jgi:hypothetical protein